MPESVPSSLIIDAFKEIFQSERKGAKRQEPLGWIISVPDTHQKSVLAALDKERSLRVLTCSTDLDSGAFPFTEINSPSQRRTPTVDRPRVGGARPGES